MKTLLVIIPESTVNQDCPFDILVAETGEHLASHFCGSAHYAKGDLYENRPERKKEWTERFGEIEVKFIDEIEDLTPEILVERNKKWYDENNKEN